MLKAIGIFTAIGILVYVALELSCAAAEEPLMTDEMIFSMPSMCYEEEE